MDSRDYLKLQEMANQAVIKGNYDEANSLAYISTIASDRVARVTTCPHCGKNIIESR